MCVCVGVCMDREIDAIDLGRLLTMNLIFSKFVSLTPVFILVACRISSHGLWRPFVEAGVAKTSFSSVSRPHRYFPPLINLRLTYFLFFEKAIYWAPCSLVINTKGSLTCQECLFIISLIEGHTFCHRISIKLLACTSIPVKPRIRFICVLL